MCRCVGSKSQREENNNGISGCVFSGRCACCVWNVHVCIVYVLCVYCVCIVCMCVCVLYVCLLWGVHQLTALCGTRLGSPRRLFPSHLSAHALLVHRDRWGVGAAQRREKGEERGGGKKRRKRKETQRRNNASVIERKRMEKVAP